LPYWKLRTETFEREMQHKAERKEQKEADYKIAAS
jgi:hypothetical protein